MPVRDRFEIAKIALRAILSQDEKPHEIVIVDDGSVTPFEVQIDYLKTEAAASGITLKVSRHENSKGVSAARNRGFADSSGDLICFCDSDDYWMPSKLETVKRLLRSAPDTKVLFHSFFWNGGTLPIFGYLPAKKMIKLSKSLLVAFGFLNPSCFSILRSSYGLGFREDLRHYEDLEYFLRLSKKTDIWFYNDALTEMGRMPGSEGGASGDAQAMRRGAAIALEQYVGFSLVGFLAVSKILYHKMRYFLNRFA